MIDLNYTSTNYDLISLYVPPRRPLQEVIGQLQNEKTLADDIKSELVKTRVKISLIRIMLYLHSLRETPYNGFALFCNNDSLLIISPAKPIDKNIYRCDNHFHIEEGLE